MSDLTCGKTFTQGYDEGYDEGYRDAMASPTIVKMRAVVAAAQRWKVEYDEQAVVSALEVELAAALEALND